MPFPVSQKPDDRLHVVAVISNPVGYKSRFDLYRRFEREMRQYPINLVTVELALGELPHVVTQEGNPHHLRYSSFDELWHKENLINLGMMHLPPTWQYMAWVDADISFVNPSWVEDTLEALQHYMVIQPWSDCVDMGPHHQHVQHHTSFMSQYVNGAPFGRDYTFWHPGYAWAARREALDAVGGLVDFAVLGAADHHMALALIGRVESSVPGGIAPEYLSRLRVWQARAEEGIKRDVGYVPGTILHHWHGKKRDRKYVERWDILTRNGFNPAVDLRYDSQGVLALAPKNHRLRDDIRHYLRQRNEDSIDLE